MSPAAQIAERVRQLIHEGRLQPGERLPGQPTLAKHYGVARETVKRALERLTYEGLLRTEQARGTYVTDA